MNAQIILSANKHHNKERAVIQFDYSSEIVSLVKQNYPAQWSQTKKYWRITWKDFDYKKFKKVFAKHILVQGTDLRYIQNLPEHSSPKTTEIYTHVSMRSLKNIRNPLDDLDI